jgi:GntR family transcriptional repressor for pyruvate dehydrogenase complex
VNQATDDATLDASVHYASDRVFRNLAFAILSRQVAPGSPLPPEIELSQWFGVSRILVREAIHRLKTYNLVRVRQGAATIVLDPDLSTELGVYQLEVELLEPTLEDLRAITEHRIYGAAASLDLAEQRMSAEELDILEHLVDDHLTLLPAQQQADWLVFQRAYWIAIATGTRNRVCLRDTLWFFDLLGRDPRFLGAVRRASTESVQCYKRLLTAQRTRNGSAAEYLAALRRCDAPIERQHAT